ncbi:MAG: cellulase family glycosylhydrolase [Dorea sp.]|nr:cellulase family glycosylhydrolase [Dorea sp.]
MKKYGKIILTAGCLLLLNILCLSACGKSGGQEQSGSFTERPDGGSGGQSKDDGSSEGQMPDGKTSGDNALREDGMSSQPGEGTGNRAEEGIAAPSVCGKLSVKGTQLVDKNGNAVQLRGVSTHGLAWFPQYVNEDLFRELRQEWKANVVRLAMYTAESGGYCTDGDKESLKELVKRGVSYAAAQDIYVIVDWHILSDNNPNQYKEEALSFFGEMSRALSDYENVLYEICNEPNGGTSWGEIKAYAEEVIPVIRAGAPDAVILVGTPNWCQEAGQAAADPIAGYGNVMYTLHFYAATHTGALRNTMAKAIDAGLPVFVSEYGICDASGNGGLDKVQAKAWVQLMDQYKVSYVAWNLSNKEETSAVISSGVEKASGFTEDDLSDSGRWLLRILQKNAEQSGAGGPQDAAGKGSGGEVPGISDGEGEGGSGNMAVGSGSSSENEAKIQGVR